MKKCKDCKNFDRDNLYCWSGLFPVKPDNSACLVFEERREQNEK